MSRTSLRVRGVTVGRPRCSSSRVTASKSSGVAGRMSMRRGTLLGGARMCPHAGISWWVGAPAIASWEGMIRRADAIAGLSSQELDVLVIGGGITGAGVALDAAARGYSVGLVEKTDYAAGTSSRSSKLVHGGLRYLQKFDLGLVREALLERSLLVRLAPHLVTPLSLIVPSFEGKRPDRMMGVGL